MTARSLRLTQLPAWPRYLDQVQAAAYVGVAPATFLLEVKQGVWPAARERRGHRTWDRELLDHYADAAAEWPNGQPPRPSRPIQPDDISISDEEFARLFAR